MKRAILGLAATILLLLPVSVAGAEQAVKAPAVQENNKQENMMPVPISVSASPYRRQTPCHSWNSHG